MTNRHDCDLHENLERFARLWNGSEPGWTIHVHHEDIATVWVSLSDTAPSPSWFKAVRALFSDHSALSTSEFRSMLMSLGGMESEVLDGFDADDLYRRCIDAGLKAELRDRSGMYYQLINERTGERLSIDDDVLNTRVAEEAIRRGLPRRESTT